MSDRADADADADAHARERILARVRTSLGVAREARAAFAARHEQALVYLDEHRRGPNPPLPEDGDARVVHFMARATELASSAERVATQADVPHAVARYLGDAPPALAVWPALAALPWRAAGLALADSRDAPVGVTGCFCAVAETGTLLLTTGEATPITAALLPETHVAVVPRTRIVGAMEDAFALLRRECGEPPRGLHFISGPSRTADIDQTLVMGAHGPYRVHLIVVDDA